MQNEIAKNAPDVKKQRDVSLDVVKGLGIILMVVGHSGAPVAVTNFIYLFHMALFFMASGYVWNDKKVQDIPTLLKSIWSRVKGLWIPYTVANGIFTLLTNVFVKLHIYSQEQLLTSKQLIINLFKNMLFAGDTVMGGAAWFFRTLFLVSIAHVIVRYIATRIKFGKVFFAVVVVLTLVGAEFVNITRIELPMGVHTCFCGYAAYLLGMLLRRIDISRIIKKFWYLFFIGGFAAVALLSQFDTIGLGAGNIGNLPFYFAASLCGWLMTWGVAVSLKGRVAKFLAFCSRSSVWIVLVHFLAFKPVAYLYLSIKSISTVNLAKFPVYTAPWLWIAYSVAGVLLPLLLCLVVRKGTEFAKSVCRKK